MKILFTGSSSFTGYWFVSELARAGHETVTTMRRDLAAYTGIRRARVDGVLDVSRSVCGCSFGDERFMEAIEREEHWDVLCHHAADVRNYKSAEFDVVAALEGNTRNADGVLEALRSRGCNRVVITGSVFEGGEGAGSEGLPAFSPYGVSKALTAQLMTYYARSHNMRVGKFVIPNPFGPFEEARFLAYLMRCWFDNQTAVVNSAKYVRDNIHVSLLAKAYVDFVENLPSTPGFSKANPSGYVESQGTFACRVAGEMRRRLGLACELDLKHQKEFTEPRIRINTDPVDGEALGWDEGGAWDQLAEFYRRTISARQEDGVTITTR